MPNTGSLKIHATTLLAAVSLTMVALNGQAAETVRLGSVGGVTDAGIYLAKELGFFAETSLEVELKRMANAPALVAATATSQLDVAGIAITPGLFLAPQQGLGVTNRRR